MGLTKKFFHKIFGTKYSCGFALGWRVLKTEYWLLKAFKDEERRSVCSI